MSMASDHARQHGGSQGRLGGDHHEGTTSARQRAGGAPGDAASIASSADGVRGFEEVMGELEEIARSLESGQLPLDEALRLYEHGMRLAQVCQALLDRADLRVRRLVASEDGEYTIHTLDIELES